jgi:wyosine [tRNA(Phe)-imidazoG37] synthetase (radical SAM superfamily)
MSSLVQYHPRSFREFRYVYPVISRRAGGLSLGINLSPNGQCNFSCVYCQVIAENGRQRIDTKSESDLIDCDCNCIESELSQLIGMIKSGDLFKDEWFSRAPAEKRILKDIAFSGDGEPTLSPAFDETINRVVSVRKRLCNESTKIVLITNATMLHVKHVQDSLETMLKNNGEIWAKLDAGTPEYFKKIARSAIKYEKILTNLKELTKKFPVVIQSCFLSMHGKIPDESEIRQYAQRLIDLQSNNNNNNNTSNNIIRVQMYTVARSTPESWALPISNEQLDSIAETVRKLTGLQVDTFYSA